MPKGLLRYIGCWVQTVLLFADFTTSITLHFFAANPIRVITENKPSQWVVFCQNNVFTL